MVFKRSGSAISALGRAVSPGGGGGGALKPGDVRFSTEDLGPGWLAEGETMPFNPKYNGKLGLLATRSTIDVTPSGTGQWDSSNTRTRGLAYGAGKCVVGAWSGVSARLMISDDLATFRVRGISGMTGTGSLGGFYDVIFAEGRFVAVGAQGGIVLLHPSDESVEILPALSGTLSNIQYLHGRYLLKGTARRWSTDLINWNDMGLGTTTSNIVELPSGDLVAGALNSGTIYKSSNSGATWTAPIYSTTINDGLGHLLVFNGVLFGTGRDANRTLWRSEDEGETWEAVGQLPNNFSGLIDGGGYMITGWSGQLLTSVNEGKAWELTLPSGGANGDMMGSAKVGDDTFIVFERRRLDRVSPLMKGVEVATKPGPAHSIAYTKL